MAKPTSQLASLRTLIRYLTTSTAVRKPRFTLAGISPPPPHHFPDKDGSLFRPFSGFSISSRPFSSEPPKTPLLDEEAITQSLSGELLKDPDGETLPLPKRLDLAFSHVIITPLIVSGSLNASPDAGRAVLDFLRWVGSRPGVEVDDDLLSCFVDYFGRRKDFKAANDVLVDWKGKTGKKCFESVVDRMVRAGRPTHTVALFDKLEGEYGLVRNMESLKFIVSKLCDHGFASYAEKMVKSLANEFFPDEFICDSLIRGWCNDEKLEEAKRLAGEMYRGGFELGTVAYNAILDCVCSLCRKKEPLRMQSDAEKVLVQMEGVGVPRDVETFNVLISNLCKIRMTQEAVDLFQRMGEWGCSPNEKTFLLLIRSLYQAARVGEGDEMLDGMRSSGYGDALNVKEYYGFLKILCGIERIDHAMSVFAKMKEDGLKPGVQTYDLLIGKLCAHGRLERAKALFKAAEGIGMMPVEVKSYKLDPRFEKKKPSAVKKNKRETLPEKMARKRRRLKQIRLSYVKKPKKSMRAM